jgi:hypothetical protein
MAIWLIGIDDTDVIGSPGTGSLARAVAEALAACGARPLGVTRHQLLVHPSIPYTSHNSSNCVGAELDPGDADQLFGWACEFVAERSALGSDPGVCLARADDVGPAVVDFGQRAQREVLDRAEAEQLAQSAGCRLAGLAGTRGGMIGALAAVGLRAGGNDGRFTTLGTIRELPGRARVQDILNAGVERVQSTGSDEPRAEDRVETLGWARPRLVEGQAVLWVERSNQDGVDWVVVDRRKGGADRGEH